MKLNSQEKKDFIRAMTSAQGKALATYFEGVKFHFALNEIKRKDMTEFERGKCAGVIETLELFISEFQESNQIVNDETKHQPKQSEMEDNSIADFEKAYTMANSLKS